MISSWNEHISQAVPSSAKAMGFSGDPSIGMLGFVDTYGSVRCSRCDFFAVLSDCLSCVHSQARTSISLLHHRRVHHLFHCLSVCKALDGMIPMVPHAGACPSRFIP